MTRFDESPPSSVLRSRKSPADQGEIVGVTVLLEQRFDLLARQEAVVVGQVAHRRVDALLDATHRRRRLQVLPHAPDAPRWSNALRPTWRCDSIGGSVGHDLFE